MSNNDLNLSIKSYFEHILNEQVVFDSTPNFEEITARLSKQTLASNAQLRDLLDGVLFAKREALAKAIEIIEEKVDNRRIQVCGIKTDEETDVNNPVVYFSVELIDTGEVFAGFNLHVDYDDYMVKVNYDKAGQKNRLKNISSIYAKDVIDKLGSLESNELLEIDLVVKRVKKRDNYINSYYKKVDKLLSDMSYFEIALVKYILQNGYKGIK
jgi:hypothetical protein